MTVRFFLLKLFPKEKNRKKESRSIKVDRRKNQKETE